METVSPASRCHAWTGSAMRYASGTLGMPCGGEHPHARSSPEGMG